MPDFKAEEVNREKFFQLNRKFSPVKFHAYLDAKGYSSNNSSLSPEKKLFTGDYHGFNFPLTFRQEQHTNLDVIETGTSLLLISNMFKAALEKDVLTGWKTFPIKLLDKTNREIFGYHGLSIMGRCGPINYSKSRIVYRELVEGMPPIKFYRGYEFDLKQWDHTDIFCPSNLQKIIISSRCAKIIKENCISNLRLIELSDCEIEESTAILELNQNLF